MAEQTWNQTKREYELKLEPGEKLWLCIEHGEKFTVVAKTEKEAQEMAQEWGGELIGEHKDGS